MKQATMTMVEQYEYVIIDSPPVLAVTDATVLSQLADGVLIVADAGNTRRGPLKQAVDQLRSSNAHLIGVILNKLKPKSDSYYSYYYYRHSYYIDDVDEESKEKSPSNGRPSGGMRQRRRSLKATD